MTDIGEIEILLVDDNPDDVAMTLRALRKAKIANHIAIARDGVEALQFIFGDDAPGATRAPAIPRLILLDLKLPRVEGFEVLQRIKTDPLTRSIPVVVLTSSMEQRDVVESYQLGVNSYIVKPVDFDGFVTAVGELGLYWLLLNRPPA
jgi:CheY-like chemotaxis protein